MTHRASPTSCADYNRQSGSTHSQRSTTSTSRMLLVDYSQQRAPVTRPMSKSFHLCRDTDRENRPKRRVSSDDLESALGKALSLLNKDTTMQWRTPSSPDSVASSHGSTSSKKISQERSRRPSRSPSREINFQRLYSFDMSDSESEHGAIDDPKTLQDCTDDEASFAGDVDAPEDGDDGAKISFQLKRRESDSTEAQSRENSANRLMTSLVEMLSGTDDPLTKGLASLSDIRPNCPSPRDAGSIGSSSSHHHSFGNSGAALSQARRRRTSSIKEAALQRVSAKSLIHQISAKSFKDMDTSNSSRRQLQARHSIHITGDCLHQQHQESPVPALRRVMRAHSAKAARSLSQKSPLTRIQLEREATGCMPHKSDHQRRISRRGGMSSSSSDAV